jgi:hypothetical protein
MVQFDSSGTGLAAIAFIVDTYWNLRARWLLLYVLFLNMLIWRTYPMVLTPLQIFMSDWNKVTVARNAGGHGHVS